MVKRSDRSGVPSPKPFSCKRGYLVNQKNRTIDGPRRRGSRSIISTRKWSVSMIVLGRIRPPLSSLTNLHKGGPFRIYKVYRYPLDLNTKRNIIPIKGRKSKKGKKG